MLNELGSFFDRVSPYNYNIALIDLSEGQSKYYTYIDLEDNINYFANGLVRLGLNKGDRISIIGNNSFKYVVAYFAIRRVGFVPVLINTKLSANQIEEIIKHSDTQYIFYEDEFLNKMPLGYRSLSFNREYESFLIKEKFQENNDDPQRPAFFLYTSGSTGTPKGVVVTSESRKWLVNNLRNKMQSRVLLSAPLYHMNGLSNLEIRLAEYSTIVLHPKFQVEQIISSLANHRISTISAVPPMMAMLLEKRELLSDTGYPQVRSIILASAPTSKELYNQISTVFKFAQITIRYGLTEVGPSLFGNHPTLPTPPMSVGFPMDRIQYKLVDGVLHIKSPSMLTSYHKNSERLLQALDADGYFNTNDRFTVDENGFYFFEGRSDDMFVSGGENVYPMEVENILESHPSVNQAAVLGIEDNIKGFKPYAFVVSNDNFLTEDSLKDYFLNNAPAYLQPRRIWFLDSFPLTGTNKIDKQQLTEQAKNLLSSS